MHYIVTALKEMENRAGQESGHRVISEDKPKEKLVRFALTPIDYVPYSYKKWAVPSAHWPVAFDCGFNITAVLRHDGTEPELKSIQPRLGTLLETAAGRREVAKALTEQRLDELLDN